MIDIYIGNLRHQLEAVPQALIAELKNQYHGFTSTSRADTKDFQLIRCEICYFNTLNQTDMGSMQASGWRFWNPLGEIVSIDGLEFIVALSPDHLQNRLYIPTPEILRNRIVIENYLRVSSAYALLNQGGCLLHSGGFVYEHLAWLFVGVSGAGKTTVTEIAHLGEATILSDDINIIQRSSLEGYVVAPVPFAGEFGTQHNMKRSAAPAIPVGGIFRIEKSNAFAITPLQRVTQQVTLIANMPFVNNVPELSDNVDALVTGLTQIHPLQRLAFNKAMKFEELANGLERFRMEKHNAA